MVAAASENARIVPGTGITNPADGDAYNVIRVAESNLSATDIARITLIGWAEKTPSLFSAINLMSPEEVASLQRTIDQTLARTTDMAARRAFTTKQRDFLIVRSADRRMPQQTAPPPFEVLLANRSFTLRSLPSANADRIGTFEGDAIAAQLDCYTMPCMNGWIGLRVSKGAEVLRGWASADDLKTAVAPGISIMVEYDGNRVSPRRDSIEAITRAARPDRSTPPSRGRIQVIATRSSSRDSKSSFIAGARLSFLDRLLIDLEVNASDIVKTVLEAPDASQLPPVIVNLGKR